MRRKNRKLPLVLAAVVLCLLMWMGVASKFQWTGAEELPFAYRVQVQTELRQAQKLLSEEDLDRDGAEQRLIEAGFATLDSDRIYPEYLANNDGLHTFWEKASQGKNAALSLFRITEEGLLRHLLFVSREGGTWFYTTEIPREPEGSLLPRITSALPVYDMELSDWGIFYYRCYPAGDPHYIDYSQIRLEPVDRECYDLARRYILPIGYQLVNVFLVDWQGEPFLP